jgi:hypothetical protein
MKMEDASKWETFEEQEERARQALSVGALIKAAILAALLVNVTPAGGPWMSQEAFTNAMARVLTDSLLFNLVAHLVLAGIYGTVIAMFIYRPPTPLGILLGVAFVFPLYLLNYAIFVLGAGDDSNEIHVAIAHLLFCLYFSVSYRALAVPKPRRKD